MASLWDYAVKDFDWITMEWSGLSDDDEEEWSCFGDGYICVKRVWLPVQGPVHRDGVPLGYLLVTE
jgi:hypothetical protein